MPQSPESIPAGMMLPALLLLFISKSTTQQELSIPSVSQLLISENEFLATKSIQFDTLVDQLSRVGCLIHVVALDYELVHKLTDRLQKPLVIESDTANKFVSTTKYLCHIYVGRFDMTGKEENIDVFNSWASQIYLIANSTEKPNIDNVSFKNPLLVFQPYKRGELLLHLRCHPAEASRVANIWNPYTGWVRNIQFNRCSTPLKGLHINVTGLLLPPYIMIHGNRVSGFDPHILTIMAKKLEFTYTIVPEQDVGVETAHTGIWTGATGKVKNESAQLGIAGIAIQETRHNAVDFLYLLHPVDVFFVSAKPRPKLTYLNVLRPYSTMMWIAVFITLVFATLILTFLARAGIAKDYHNGDMTDILFSAYTLLIQQHFALKSHRPSLRIAYGIWHVATFFFVASYICNLRSYLMQVEFEKPIDSEEDIISQGRHLYLSHDSLYNNLFATSPIASQQEIYKTTNYNKHFYSFEKGNTPKALEAEVIHHGAVIVSSQDRALSSFATADKMYGHQPFHLGKKIVFHLQGGFIIPKNTFWASEMNAVIVHLVEGGVIQKLHDSYVSQKYLAEEAPDMSPVAFGMSHIMGSLIVLLGGIIVSLVTFGVEHIVQLTFRKDFKMNEAFPMNSSFLAQPSVKIVLPRDNHIKVETELTLNIF